MWRNTTFFLYSGLGLTINIGGVKNIVVIRRIISVDEEHNREEKGCHRENLVL